MKLASLALVLCLAVPGVGLVAVPAAALEPEVTVPAFCVAGFSKTIRPSFWESQKLKLQLLRERGETWAAAPLYQLDHIIPLCLGGDPTDRSNLQLQLWPDAKKKDRLEIQACRCVCAGVVSLDDARADLSRADWLSAYNAYAKLKCRRGQ